MFPILNHPPLLPPHTIPLGRPSAPAPSIQYRAWDLDWETLVNHKILRVIAIKREQTKGDHIKCSLNLMKLQREQRLNSMNLKIIIDMTYIEAIILMIA